MASLNNSDADTIQSSQNSLPSKMKLIIHHQLPGVELVSPAYAGNGITCYLSPDQRVDIGSTAQVGFKIDFSKSESIGILMYNLKNTDPFSEAISSEEATSIQIVMTLKIYKSGKFCVYSSLIEHDKGYIWDSDKLMKLVKYFKLYDLQRDPIEVTYLMYNNTVLMARINITCEEEYYKLEITLSETSIKDDTRRLEYFDVNK
jgi:hypothetical protein